MPPAQTEASLVKRQKEIAKVEAAFNQVNEKHSTLTTKLASDEELLQTLLTGLSSSNAKNKGGGYMGQLAEARARIAQATAEEEQNKVKLSMSEKELGDLQGRMRALAKEAGDNVKKLENLKAAVAALEGTVTASGWSAEKDRELDMNLRQAREQVKQLTEVCLLLIVYGVHDCLFRSLFSNATACARASRGSASTTTTPRPTSIAGR